MNNDNKTDKAVIPSPSLPIQARLPINRCNLPAVILGGLSFQRHPVALRLDGVMELHEQLFELLDGLETHEERARRFNDYMVVQFRLHKLEDAGLDDEGDRAKANYLRLIRGWLFDPDGREAAVLKGWVESRFGLLPRYHGGPLLDYGNEYYQRYLAARAEGLYGTNALEAQLDLLYSYCQYELARLHPQTERLRLYRGVNGLDAYDILERDEPRRGRHRYTLLFNNLNSFSIDRDRASEFGDILIEAEIPWQKVLYYSRLFPGTHIGEDEYLVIGGVYDIETTYW